MLPPGVTLSPKPLIDSNTLKHRVEELGKEISSEHAGQTLTIVSISNGATIFVADLARHIDLPIRMDSLPARSYHGTTSSGTVDLPRDLKLDLEGEHVLVVDDILDTGRTLKRVVEHIRSMHPRSVETCVLLDKPARRAVDIKADRVGFEIPDSFVVGYGLDYNEFLRNLPYIAELAQEISADS